jgi:hypothetical protein
MQSVLTSGLVAGITINISGVALVPVIGKEMDAILEQQGLAPLGVGAMIYFGVMSLILGIFLVWIYALARPRLGARLKTAVIVSLVVWFLTYFWSNAAMVVFGFMPVSTTVIGTAWGLVEILLAGIIGARLYQENKVN